VPLLGKEKEKGKRDRSKEINRDEQRVSEAWNTEKEPEVKNAHNKPNLSPGGLLFSRRGKPSEVKLRKKKAEKRDQKEGEPFFKICIEFELL